MAIIAFEYDFFTSIIRGYLYTKFENFSTSQSWVMARGQKEPPPGVKKSEKARV